MVPHYKFCQKDAQVKKACKCSFVHKFYEGKIPSKNWGQMHCDDACSTTAKLLLCNLYCMVSSRSTQESDLEIKKKNSKVDLLWWRDVLASWNGAPLCKKAIEVQLEMDAYGTG